HNCAVVNLRHFGLEEVLNQFRNGARDDHTRAFAGFIHGLDDHAHALANGERLKPRLFLARHARFRFADVKDHVGAFDALDGGVHDLTDTADVFVVDSVALGFAHLLENDLLGKLRRDTTKAARL